MWVVKVFTGPYRESFITSQDEIDIKEVTQ